MKVKQTNKRTHKLARQLSISKGNQISEKKKRGEGGTKSSFGSRNYLTINGILAPEIIHLKFFSLPGY